VRSRGRGEAGAYLILYALLAVVFFTVAAIVLDIAALRQGRRADRTAADLAVTAGVTEIDTTDPSTFARACEAAWGYVLANKTEAGGAISAPPCNSTFPAADACNALTPARTASATIGPLTIEITHPVPNSSPLMLAEAQGGDVTQSIYAPADGTSCERLGVRIVRTRQFLFAQIAGAVGGTTDVHSVARALTTTSTTEIPGLVALERTGCDAVTTDAAGGHLDVEAAGQGGVILVDSDGSSCGGSYTIRPDASGRIRAVNAGPASGVISSFALAGTNFPVAYDPADVGAGRLAPQPTPALIRTGRAIIDNRYNCTGSSCAAGSDEVDQLEAADGGPGAPAGHTVYSGPCTIPNTGVPELVIGDTYVDCPVLEIFGSVTFSGASVVLAGDVIVRAGACVAVNSTECGAAGVASGDAVAFVRGSVTKEPTAGVFLRRTFLWAGGSVDVPLDPDKFVVDSALGWTAPTGGRFQDLLLWDEAGAPVRLAEQDATEIEGTVFAPNTTVVLSSRPGGASLDLPLQVVAGRVRLEGGGDVSLAPAAGRATGRLTRQVRLIR
jgi:hypothetical protein